MTISYNWLHEYLPEKIEPKKLSRILTSIGLEVECMEEYEAIPGGLQGLVIGKIIVCEKHPNADKLKLTQVDIGTAEPLQIVCGAHNVAIGQKVVVATAGTTIYPLSGEPLTIQKTKIRGIESQGMICAEDEIGLGENHDGIIILPEETKTGDAVAAYFQPYEDLMYEIGLTPNRMDAMSHMGVAKDICAYLSHHNKKETVLQSPFKNNFKADHQTTPVTVTIENTHACRRYTGVLIEDVSITESPGWLKQKLKSIGVRPINNIVDITNFILHETGQPLHAFDADSIKGNTVIVKNLPDGTLFTTLDEKERKLSAEDLMICNSDEPMCIGGVYGGLHSGIHAGTKNIFLESAWFLPTAIRKTSLRHDLRTDAAARFEKGVDIENTVNVLKRAALMIKELAGGKIANGIIDVYPIPTIKAEISLTYHYLKKLSGKNYHSDAIKNILKSLGFEVLKESADEIRMTVPFSKPDISIPADIVEEIMRIDGLDNIDIPASILIAPSVETHAREAAYTEKIAGCLVGLGFREIFTNSITNSAHFNEEVLPTTVKMINNLSEELNMLRPRMLESGLTAIAYNTNRKNTDIKFFEWGKTYTTADIGKYKEEEKLAVYITGNKYKDSWKDKAQPVDFYFLKSVFEKIIEILGLHIDSYEQSATSDFYACLEATIDNEVIGIIGIVNNKILDNFNLKQQVIYTELDWNKLLLLNKKNNIQSQPISKYPLVQRDLSILVDKKLPYAAVETATYNARISKLESIHLFDMFENEKWGADKKSLAVSLTFSDKEKTLTDKEIDEMLHKIIASYEKELNAEIRK